MFEVKKRTKADVANSAIPENFSDLRSAHFNNAYSGVGQLKAAQIVRLFVVFLIHGQNRNLNPHINQFVCDQAYTMNSHQIRRRPMRINDEQLLHSTK